MRFPGIVVLIAIATLGAVGEAAETTRLPALFKEETQLDPPSAESLDAVHVILMSGYGQSDDGKLEHALLSKPFTRKQLLDFVAQQVA